MADDAARARLLAEIADCTRKVEEGMRAAKRRTEAMCEARRLGISLDRITRAEARAGGRPVSGPKFVAHMHRISVRLYDHKQACGLRFRSEVVRETIEYAPSTTDPRE